MLCRSRKWALTEKLFANRGASSGLKVSIRDQYTGDVSANANEPQHQPQRQLGGFLTQSVALFGAVRQISCGGANKVLNRLPATAVKRPHPRPLRVAK